MNESEFIKEIRSFLDEAVPEDIRENTLNGMLTTKEETQRWHQILYEKGWAAPTWKKEFGGPGWSARQVYLFEEELAKTPAPLILPFGTRMLGPVLMQYGTKEQQAKYLPTILDGSVFWCQGYSEPGAGSDLAALKTSAVLEGGNYIVNGSKIWTSFAHWSEMIFCLVRTKKTERKQDGISFLLIDLSSPGVEITPIKTIDGHHHLNQVFFEDVKVPAENLVGAEGQGWSCAKAVLEHERTSLAGVSSTRENLRQAEKIAADISCNGIPVSKTDDFCNEVITIEARLRALEGTVLRTLDHIEKHNHPGPEASLLKLVGTELEQAVDELAVKALGSYAALHMPEAQLHSSNEEYAGPEHANMALSRYFFRRAASIYGGSNEIQRNIISKAVLGLS